jgi:hypothetical protein
LEEKMQVPPEQPVGPGGYPRPPGYGQPETFQADKIMGIILIVLAALGACGSLALVGIGGLGTAAGVAAKDAEGSTAVATAGGGLMIFGVLLLAICVVEIVGGVWIIKSLRKGFMTIAVLGAIGLVVNIVAGAMAHSFNFFGLGTGLIFPIYSVLRLMGNVGPKPID